MEMEFNDYLISDSKNLLQIDRIHTMLKSTYWANNREIETIKKSIDNSLCFGVYKNNVQVGFARCVTDFATAYWLCDVVIENDHRGLGLGKALMKIITEHDEIKNLLGILGTKDAHGLYEQYGFNRDKEAFMRKRP